jgi:hypothetical protein
VGVEDAELLAREFYPVFAESDLVRLPNHHIYLKLLIDGAPSEPFSAYTLPPRPKRTSHRQQIIDRSRRQYARPRREVEQAMAWSGPQPLHRSAQRRLL